MWIWKVRYLGVPEGGENAERMESEIVGTLADVVAAHPEDTIVSITNIGPVAQPSVDAPAVPGVADAGKGADSITIAKSDVGDAAAVLGGKA